MDIVNSSQCHSVDTKNNRLTFLSSPIGVTAPSTVRRQPVTATVTSRDYYQNQQRSVESYASATFDSNINNTNNNNNTKLSDESDSNMYQEMSSFYHHSQHRSACAGYNVPPAAYDMRSFGAMSTAMAIPNVQLTPPPPPPPPSMPMPIPMHQHHERHVHQTSSIRPHIEPNFNNTTTPTPPSATSAWYQAPSMSTADEMINMLYMNNR